MSYVRLPLFSILNPLRRTCYSLLCLYLSMSVVFADPEVSKVWGRQNVPSYKVDIFYDLSEAATVSLAVSADDGANWGIVRVDSCSCDIGTNVTAGSGKHILWDAGVDWPGQYSSTVRFKVMATACAPDPSIPIGMALIPTGSFQMGDSFTEGSTSERPVHTVYVSGFYMDKYEVTKARWDEVANWAASNGYDLTAAGAAGVASSHPAQTMTWFRAVKWCNARSQKEGLTPCYTVGGAVYKTGDSAPDCNWSANGYRLPTEAEWEKAARGGLSGRRFPWGDTIQHSKANYYSATSYAYDTSPTRGYHPTYNDGTTPYTSPVGSFTANGYGLYDMAGNVWEWCWDWYGSTYYSSSPGSNPRGPSSGSYRVRRGGGWGSNAIGCRAASRSYITPSYSSYYFGFRPVRRAP